MFPTPRRNGHADLTDRKPRDLDGLRFARRSGRILNLNEIYRDIARGAPEELEHSRLFENKVLNRAVLMKHDLREHERDVVRDKYGPVLKIFIPFNANRYTEGGWSTYFGEPMTEISLIENFGLKAEGVLNRTDRDYRILQLLDTLPTLDTFIVKELFVRAGIKVGGSFWAYADNRSDDAENYVVASFAPLVRKAAPNADAQTIKRASREILNFRDTDVSRALEQTLQIDYAKWPDVTFAWQSALYYEFNLTRILEQYTELTLIAQRLQVTQVYDRKSAEAAKLMFVDFVDVLAHKLESFQNMVVSFREAFSHDLIENADIAGFRNALRFGAHDADGNSISARAPADHDVRSARQSDREFHRAPLDVKAACALLKGSHRDGG